MSDDRSNHADLHPPDVLLHSDIRIADSTDGTQRVFSSSLPPDAYAFRKELLNVCTEVGMPQPIQRLAWMLAAAWTREVRQGKFFDSRSVKNAELLCVCLFVSCRAIGPHCMEWFDARKESKRQPGYDSTMLAGTKSISETSHGMVTPKKNGQTRANTDGKAEGLWGMLHWSASGSNEFTDVWAGTDITKIAMVAFQGVALVTRSRLYSLLQFAKESVIPVLYRLLQQQSHSLDDAPSKSTMMPSSLGINPHVILHGLQNSFSEASERRKASMHWPRCCRAINELVVLSSPVERTSGMNLEANTIGTESVATYSRKAKMAAALLLEALDSDSYSGAFSCLHRSSCREGKHDDVSNVRHHLRHGYTSAITFLALAVADPSSFLDSSDSNALQRNRKRNRSAKQNTDYPTSDSSDQMAAAARKCGLLLARSRLRPVMWCRQRDNPDSHGQSRDFGLSSPRESGNIQHGSQRGVQNVSKGNFANGSLRDLSLAEPAANLGGEPSTERGALVGFREVSLADVADAVSGGGPCSELSATEGNDSPLRQSESGIGAGSARLPSKRLVDRFCEVYTYFHVQALRWEGLMEAHGTDDSMPGVLAGAGTAETTEYALKLIASLLSIGGEDEVRNVSIKGDRWRRIVAFTNCELVEEDVLARELQSISDHRLGFK